MPRSWQLQDAKNRLSEVVEHALAGEPQTITRRGKDAVVVVSIDEFRRLTHAGGSLLEFFQASPLAGVELDLERSKEPPREVSL